MSVIWSHYEVLWESDCAIQNRFFDNPFDMRRWADHLASLPAILFVETQEHDSPHGGKTERTIVKSLPKSTIAARRAEKAARA